VAGSVSQHVNQFSRLLQRIAPCASGWVHDSGP
jgi:hypothetical protein